MKTTLHLSLIFFVACLVSCTKPSTPSAHTPTVSPEEVVRSFVTLSANVKEAGERGALSGHCTGEMKKAFSGMTEEQFRIFYLNGKLKIKELKVLETKVEGDAALVRYQVNVENNQGTDNTNELNEREATLRLIDGAWLIDSVKPRGIDKIAFTRGMIF